MGASQEEKKEALLRAIQGVEEVQQIVREEAKLQEKLAEISHLLQVVQV